MLGLPVVDLQDLEEPPSEDNIWAVIKTLPRDKAPRHGWVHHTILSVVLAID